MKKIKTLILSQQKKLLLLDANSLLHRAFHAVRPLFSQDGTQVNAVFGFLSILTSTIKQQKPNYIVAAFDEKEATFRHQEFAEYKAKRVKAPDELYDQIPLIKDALCSLGISVLSCPGFEADDIIGTISQSQENEEMQVIISSSDNDLLQLIRKNVCLVKPGKGGILDIFDHQKVLDKFGLSPQQIPDLKGLAGDSSDNIPGVSGIGPKTATSLIQKHENLENIYQNKSQIDQKIWLKLDNNRSKAFLSKKLATINFEAPIEFNLSESNFPPADFTAIEEFLDRINSTTLKNRVLALKDLYKKSKVQQKLFDF